MLLINPRSVVTLFGIFYSKENSDEKSRAEALCKTLFDTTAALGYSPYRTSVTSTSEVLDVNPGFKALANQLKAAIDPKHVLSPGRYGIGS